MSHPCSSNCGGTGGQLGYGGAIGQDGCCQEPCLTAAGCNVYSIQIDVWGDTYPQNNRLRLGPRPPGWLGATSAVLPHASSKFCNPAFPNEAPFFNGGDCGWHNLDLHFPAGSEAYTITLYYAAKSPGYEGKGLWYDACLREPVGLIGPVMGHDTYNQKLALQGGSLFRIHGTSTWLKAGESSPNKNNILPRLNLGPTFSLTPGCREAGDCNCQANGPYPTAALYYFTDAAANNPSSSSVSSSSGGVTSPSPSSSHTSSSGGVTSPSPSSSHSSTSSTPSPSPSGSSTSPSPTPSSSHSSASPTPSPSPSGSSTSPTPSPSPSGSSTSPTPSPSPSGSSTSPSACCPAQNYWQQGETYNNGDLVRVQHNTCT